MDLSAAPPHPAGGESGRDAPAEEALILLDEVPDRPPLVDTLRAARRLENAGFGSAQAEAIVTIVAHAGTRLATKDDIERPEGVALATEGDIEHLEASAKTDLRCLEASTKNEIQCLRTELTARMDRKIAEARKDLYALRAEVIKRMGEQQHRLVMMMIVGLGLVLIALRSA